MAATTYRLRGDGRPATASGDARPAATLVRLGCAVAVFASATLVFLVEPMIAKMVLPILGGSSAVWNTSLAFFQGTLLLGYAYAHALQRLRSVRAQTLIHAALLVAAGSVLPLGVSGALGEPDGHDPALWLLGVLALSVGLPFAALSATAPLFQAWYARAAAGRTEASNPYTLYAASNLGSLLALLAYPVVIEPTLSLKAQSFGWSVAYGGFALLAGGVAALMWRRGAAGAEAVRPAAASTGIGWIERVSWVALAAAPSSLMLGVTTHIASDIASAPFLWLLPLALYLVTFIIAFQAKPLIRPATALVLQAAAFVACLLTIGLTIDSVLLQAALDLVGFFLTALVCHQALASRRPAAGRLTEFYLLVSLGGVIGGAFNAFLAPALFKTVLEYPVVLALSALARPWANRRPTRSEVLLMGTGLAAGIAAIALGQGVGLGAVAKAMLAVTVVATFLLRDRSVPFLVLCLAVLAAGLSFAPRQDVVFRDRSFFGVVRLVRSAIARHGDAVLMVHGTTLHGAQLLDPADRCRPLLYYAPTTPIGQVFRNVQSRKAAVAIGAIGMGTGTVAAYTRSGDTLRFFEIDPLVARIAGDPSRFSYIHGCAQGAIDAVLGDGRQTLAHEPDDRFDILLVDAFSSDSVPAHLLTREAMRGYLRHIKADGIVVMHLSNNNLELMRPVAAIAEAAGGTALRQAYRPPNGAVPLIDISEDAVIVARTPGALAPFRTDARWKPADPRGVGVWTDDYGNLLGALIRGIGHAERELGE